MKRQSLYFILFSFFALSGNAQNYNIYNVDSVLRRAEAAAGDSARTTEYYRAFQLLLFKGDLKRGDSVVRVLGAAASRSDYNRAKVVYHLCQGRLYEMQGKYPLAVEHLLKGIKIAEENRMHRETSEFCNSLAIIHFTQEEYDKALEYYLKAIDISKKNNIPKNLATFYNNIGNIYYRKKDFGRALDYYNVSIEQTRKMGDKTQLATFLNNLASIYIVLKQYDKAEKCLAEAKTIGLEVGDQFQLAYTYLNEAEVHIFYKRYDASLHNLKLALEMADKIGSPEVQRDAYFALSELYTVKNDAPKAVEFYKKFEAMKDSLNNISFSKQINEKELSYAYEKKEMLLKAESEKKLIQLAEDRKRNRLVLLFSLLGLLLITIFTLFLFKRYQVTSRQKKVIEEKSAEIVDSINYARRLQAALLIPEEELSKYFSQAFIIFRPRNIVSGDFYWYAESENNRILAVADCTGHGVPGALMSMLGYESLQDIVLKENVDTTSVALKQLDRKITDMLNKSGKTFRDGMDIALCAFSKKENTLQYSGANRPLLHYSAGQLTEYAPDKNTIGGDIDGTSKEYSTKIIQYKPGDVFYLFSDGYADQFGGEKGKKYKYKQLKETLQSASMLSLAEQKKVLEDSFDTWRGQLEQVDDVCMIGIRV